MALNNSNSIQPNLNTGQPVERFWKFCNPSGHDSTSISRYLQGALDKVGYNPDKIISDDVNVTSGQSAGVQAIIQLVYKNSHFMHCYAQVDCS